MAEAANRAATIAVSAVTHRLSELIKTPQRMGLAETQMEGETAPVGTEKREETRKGQDESSAASEG